jgi:hypothetical protein
VVVKLKALCLREVLHIKHSRRCAQFGTTHCTGDYNEIIEIKKTDQRNITFVMGGVLAQYPYPSPVYVHVVI